MQKWQTPPKRIKDNVLIGSFQKKPKKPNQINKQEKATKKKNKLKPIPKGFRTTGTNIIKFFAYLGLSQAIQKAYSTSDA